MSKLNRDKLEEMTAVELKELLQKQGLSTSGNKQALVDRLLNANPGGAGVFVIEAVSAPHPKKDAAAPPTRQVPIATAAEAAEDAAADPTAGIATEPVADSPVPESASTPPADDAAALITQLKDLIAQAQIAAEAAQKAQQAAEAAAASVKPKKEKKDKKGDKKKDKKKKE
jgi:hypothetical protein